MDKYTIYCTESQTKKALELGAPIVQTCGRTNGKLILSGHCLNGEITNKDLDGFGVCDLLQIPTAEQMRGWLEDIFHIQIDVTFRVIDYDWSVRDMYDTIVSQSMHVESRKEATLAAIDAALEYLSNNKK